MADWWRSSSLRWWLLRALTTEAGPILLAWAACAPVDVALWFLRAEWWIRLAAVIAVYAITYHRVLPSQAEAERRLERLDAEDRLR